MFIDAESFKISGHLINALTSTCLTLTVVIGGPAAGSMVMTASPAMSTAISKIAWPVVVIMPASL